MSREKTAKNMKAGAFLTRVLIILLIGSLLLTLGSVFTFPAEGKRTGDNYENSLVDPITVVDPQIKPRPIPYPYPLPDNGPPIFNGIKYANVTNETLTLSWDLALDPSLPITYNIYQATICGGQNFSTPAYTTQNLSIQVPCSGDGVTYYYVVTAEDSVGNEENNTVECAYTKTVVDYVIYIEEEVIELGYSITIWGDIYLPDIGKITVENLKIDSYNNILTHGTISITELNISGYIVNVSGIFDDRGVLLSGNLTLPGTAGGGVVGVEDLRISYDGKFSGTMYISNLNININNYVVNIEKGVFNNTGLIFNGSLTLPATVGGSAVAVENLNICSDGNFSATISISNLNIGGYIIDVLTVSFDNKGLIVDGSFTLPVSVGGATVLISSLAISSNGDYFGTVSITDLNINNYIVNVVSVTFDTKGLIITGSITLPSSVGGGTFTVKDLQICSNGAYAGTVSITNLNINNYTINIDSVTFNNTGLIVTGSLALATSVGGGTIGVNDLKIDASGQFSGTVTITSLVIDGYTINVLAVTFNNTGLIVSGSLTLPASVGGTTVSVRDLKIDANGQFSGTVTITSLTINGYTVNVLKVTFNNTGLIVTGSLTLPTSVSGATVSVSNLKISSNGDFSGTVSVTDLDINGYIVDIDGVTFDNKGLIVSGSLTLPASVGGSTISVSNLAINSNGDYSGSVTISNLNISGYIINVLTVSFDNKGLTVDGSLTLPTSVGGAIVSVSSLVISSNGDFSGTVSITNLDINGYVVTIASVTFGNKGLIISASFTLPASVGGATVSVSNLAISSNGDYSGTVSITNLNIEGYIVNVDSITFDNKGLIVSGSLTLPAEAGGAIISVKDLKINSTGTTIGSVSISSLNVAGYLVSISVSGFQDGIITVSGSLGLPTSVGGATVTVKELKIDSKGVTFSVIEVYADLDIKGVKIRVDTAKITPNGVVIDTASVTVPPISGANIGGGITANNLIIKSNGDVDGSISGLSLEVAGFGFGVNNVKLIKDGIYVESASFKLPEPYTVSASVTEFTFNSSGISLKSCSVTVPTFEVAGYTLSGMTASFEYTATGWRLYADATLGIPDWYGIEVNCTIESDGLKAFGLKVPGASIPIGSTPLILKDPGFFFDLTYYPTVTCEFYGTIAPVTDCALVNTVEADLTLRITTDGTLEGTSVTGIGILTVIDYPIADATVTINNTGIYGEGNVDIATIITGRGYLEIRYDGKITIHGEGSVQVLTYTFASAQFNLDNNHFVANATIDLPINGTIAGINFDLSQHLDIGFGIYSATETTEAHADGHLSLDSHFEIEPLVDYELSLNANLYINSSAITIWDNHLRLTWNYGALIPEIKWSMSDNPQAISVGDSYWTDSYGNKITRAYPGDSVTAHLVFVGNDGGAPGIKAFGRPVNVRLVRDISNWDDAVVIETDIDGWFIIGESTEITLALTVETTGVDWVGEWYDTSYDRGYFVESSWSGDWEFWGLFYWPEFVQDGYPPRLDVGVDDATGTWESSSASYTLLSEDFEGAWPGSWSLADTDSNSGEDYWGDSSYRAYAGSWSGWCADIGSRSSTVTDTIFYEDFEGVWPGSWVVGDSDTNSGSDYWGDNSYRAYAGYWSGYCSDEGDTGVNHKYDNNMYAYMYRTVSLGGYGSATLTFYLWLNSESGYDYFKVIYYDGTSWVELYSREGNTSGWIYVTVSIPTTATAVGFLFDSEGSVTYEGAYVDEVTFTATKTVDTPNSNTHTYDNNMYASMYRTVDLSGYDSAELQFYLWLDSESNYDYFYAGYYDTSWHWIYSRTGNTGGWIYVSTDIPTTATAVGFLFDSDASVYSYEGAYIDDVVLKATKTISAKSIDLGASTLTISRYMLESRTEFPSQGDPSNPERIHPLFSSCIKNNNLLSAGKGGIEKIACKT